MKVFLVGFILTMSMIVVALTVAPGAIFAFKAFDSMESRDYKNLMWQAPLSLLFYLEFLEE